MGLVQPFENQTINPVFIRYVHLKIEHLKVRFSHESGFRVSGIQMITVSNVYQILMSPEVPKRCSKIL